MKRVIVFGATSLVGRYLIDRLLEAEIEVAAVSRQSEPGFLQHSRNLIWIQIDALQVDLDVSLVEGCDAVVSLMPIWFAEQLVVRNPGLAGLRWIAFSSTSSISKIDSADSEERRLASQLIAGEEFLLNHPEFNATVFRPTLIYGAGRDKNVTAIAGLIQRIGFFPLIGRGSGLRQPVHAQDLASACISALNRPDSSNKAYNLVGGDTLSYREMVGRIFVGLGRKPRLITVPVPLFQLVLKIASVFPRYRHLNVQMARRMNKDLSFDSSAAQRDFGYSARGFKPPTEDLIPYDSNSS